MEKYVLLGGYNPIDSKDEVKIIHTSDDINKLKNVWETIDNFSLEMSETFDGDLSKKALKMIEKNRYLNDLFELFHDTILWTVDIIGIFKAVKTKSVHGDKIEGKNTLYKHFCLLYQKLI